MEQTIRKLSYELYKIDWKKNHNITYEKEMNNIKDYYKGLVDEDSEYTYEDYLDEFGYNGEIYACFDEFMDMEYEDEEYMQTLLNDKELFKKYLEDVR